MPAVDVDKIVAGVVEGDKTSVALALNLVEDRRPQSQRRVAELLKGLHTRRVEWADHRVGLTGPPGVGKSTLVATLARELRRRERRVGVVAVDPSSMRSGGALLGDRARMSFDPADEGLFIRSLATGGDSGGLAYATHAAVEVLSAAFDIVLVETTGVGQTETDVEHVVDTVSLVVQPGSGDVLQFIKAGIMEIPDVLVVNKGDLGKLAERAASDLERALDTVRSVTLEHAPARGWSVPVLLTSAREATGMPELADALQQHRDALGEQGLRRERMEGAIQWTLSLLLRRHGEHATETLGGVSELRGQIRKELEQGTSPVGVFEGLAEGYLRAIRASD